MSRRVHDFTAAPRLRVIITGTAPNGDQATVIIPRVDTTNGDPLRVVFADDAYELEEIRPHRDGAPRRFYREPTEVVDVHLAGEVTRPTGPDGQPLAHTSLVTSHPVVPVHLPTMSKADALGALDQAVAVLDAFEHGAYAEDLERLTALRDAFRDAP